MELNYSKAIGAPKDELKFTFQLNHQPSINHDTIVLQYIKCLFIGIFILVKDESLTFAF
jgi:hypothetical protein